MAYLASKLKFRTFAAVLSPFPSISLLQRLSLRGVQGMAAAILACTVLAFLLLWQPAYLRLRALQRETTYWQDELKLGATNTRSTIPTMDQLPDLIEQCRGAFEKENVKVVALNVERFGERRETGNGVGLDYGLVRLHLRGNWEGIVTSLEVLEGTQEGNIYLQEVVLNTEGGEALLQIHFRTGE